MSIKEIRNILIALNSSNNFGEKYPFGNKELTEKVKSLELEGKISYDKLNCNWKKGK